MQLTFDSNQPLADVVRVVGSLYGVTLTVVDGDDVPVHPTSEGSRPRRREARSGRKRGVKAAPGVDARTVRGWAAANGFEVSTRGSLPAAVRAAYAEAHAS